MVLNGVHSNRIPLGVHNFVAWEEIQWGSLTATAIIAMVPVIVFYFVQNALIRGLTMGAINA